VDATLLPCIWFVLLVEWFASMYINYILH